MIHNFTISFFESGANIHFMSTRGPESIDSIPEEIKGYVDYIVQYLESYKTPREQIAEEVIKSFIETATVEELLAKQELFDEWQSGEHYEAGSYVRANGRLYKVQETHAAIVPPGANSRTVYARIRGEEEILPFREVDSPEDAYVQGDKYVDDEGVVWESNEDFNFHPEHVYPAGWRRLGTLEEQERRS